MSGAEGSALSALFEASAMAKGWLATLGMVAVQGTLLALIAVALTRAGRLRPAWQAGIWLVVTVKLALPWSPAMPWSLADVIASLSATEASTGAVVITGGMSRVAAVTPPLWPAIGWLALATLWAAGAAFVIARAVSAHVETSQAARRAPLAPERAQVLLGQLAARIGVRAPRLAIGGAETGPHVVGIVRPTIIVPPALLDDTALLRAALLHELAHVQRRDAIARIIQIIAGALMWWLPVTRLVQRRLELAREAACDAYALEAGDISRPAYARLLVRMAQLRTPQTAPALAQQHALDARVAAVLGPPVRARLTHIHRIAIAAFAVLALGGARSAQARQQADVCIYTPQMAEALMVAYPDADLDGDGQLSRDEACDLQADLLREPEERTSRLPPAAEAEMRTLLAEPLCCNCSELPLDPGGETATCTNSEGPVR